MNNDIQQKSLINGDSSREKAESWVEADAAATCWCDNPGQTYL